VRSRCGKWIWRCCRSRRKLSVAKGASLDEAQLRVGIDSGEANFGEFGRSHRDLTPSEASSTPPPADTPATFLNFGAWRGRGRLG
jgi:hypothetical protein